MKTRELLPIQNKNASLTMSSREIAELVESRHDSVKRTIERLAEKGVIVRPPMVNEPITDMLGRYRTESVYHIGKRDSYVIVAQLSPEFTARLVDRWQELENKQSVKLPQSFSEALLLAAELQAEKERNAPKVAFVDHYVEVGTTKSLREVAKILKMPEKAMITRLIEDKALYRQSGNLLPYQTAYSKDLFTVKTGTAEHGHNFTQTRVTAKGMEWIAQRYASELML